MTDGTKAVLVMAGISVLIAYGVGASANQSQLKACQQIKKLDDSAFRHTSTIVGNIWGDSSYAMGQLEKALNDRNALAAKCEGTK